MVKFQGRMIALVVLAVTALSLSGCNTFNGVGQDLREGGRAMQRAANQ